MKILKCIIVVFSLTFSLTFNAQAAFLPTGVQFDTPLSTVENVWGWTQIYRGDYGARVLYDDMFSGHQDYIMLGAIHESSDTIELLAATSWADFNLMTAVNATTTSNGAEWYNNNLSLGFAKLGDPIRQNSADMLDSSLDGFSGPNGEYRLSWHTSNGYVNGGWRAGDTTWLNSSREWDKIVFTADNVHNVPEPSVLLLMLGGLIGFVFMQKKGGPTEEMYA